MVAPIYSNRKGIYKDLYREIDADNKKKEASLARKPRKGIYRELYRQIEFKNSEHTNNQNNLYMLTFKKMFIDISSTVSYFCTAATGGFKMILVAFMVAKKPINSYIESNFETYSDQGIYYND